MELEFLEEWNPNIMEAELAEIEGMDWEEFYFENFSNPEGEEVVE